MTETRADALGSLLAHHRHRRGLTQAGLAGLTRTLHSTKIGQIENGHHDGRLRRSSVFQLAQALDLDPYETDELLYVAGCAPVLDWQRLAERLARDLRRTKLLRQHADSLYATHGSTPPHTEAHRDH